MPPAKIKLSKTLVNRCSTHTQTHTHTHAHTHAHTDTHTQTHTHILAHSRSHSHSRSRSHTQHDCVATAQKNPMVRSGSNRLCDFPSRARGGQCCIARAMQTSAAHRALDSSGVFGCTAAPGMHPWDSLDIFLSHSMCRLSAWNCAARQPEGLGDCRVLWTFGFPAAGKAQSRSCKGVGLRGFQEVASH